MPIDRITLRWLLFLPIAAGLVAHSLVFDFVCDDAYISFVYARNLAEHGQLVFNLGDYVEGYTNFLWTVLLAATMKLGVAPEVASRVYGTAFAVGTLALVVRLSEKARGAPSPWDLAPAGLLALSSGFACWASGGLETQMFTFFWMLGLYHVVAAQPARASLATAAAALTRPEGALLFGVLALPFTFQIVRGLLRRERPSRDELMFFAPFLAVVAPYFAWRWWYYGWPLPNTAYVKAGGQVTAKYQHDLLAQGAFYVWQWAWQSKAIFAAPLAAVAAFRHRALGAVLVALTGTYLLYAWRVGGDFMGLHRFVMPLFAMTAVLVGLGLGALAERWPRFTVGATAALALLFAWSQVSLTRASLAPVADRGIDRPGYLKQYAEDRAAIGKALAPHMRPDDLSFVGGVGVQPYYARMRAYDVFGLVSEEIAHGVPPRFPRPGHQKWAPPELVLKHDPEFIFYCYAIHADPSRWSFNCGEAGLFRARGYEPVTLYVPGARREAQYYTFLKRKDRAWP